MGDAEANRERNYSMCVLWISREKDGMQLANVYLVTGNIQDVEHFASCYTDSRGDVRC